MFGPSASLFVLTRDGDFGIAVLMPQNVRSRDVMLEFDDPVLNVSILVPAFPASRRDGVCLALSLRILRGGTNCASSGSRWFICETDTTASGAGNGPNRV